jgi:hypothetical protein
MRNRHVVFSSRWMALSVVLPLMAGCTALSGPARLENPGQSAAFSGLASSSVQGATRRYVLQVHGIDTPDRDAYANQLLDPISRRGYARRSSSDWKDARLGHTWTVRGPGLAGCGERHPGCRFDAFGQYKRDVFVRGGDVLTVYSYYWRADLRDIMGQYLQSDIDSNTAPKYRFPSPKKSLLNAGMKASVMDNGFSDAVGYLSVLGRIERAGLESALCVMVADAAGADDLEGAQGDDCLAALAPRMGALASAPVEFDFLSHSLGSRMLFDVLSPYDPASGARRDAALEARWVILARSRAFFMAANQLPLLAVSDMTVGETGPGRAPAAEAAFAPQARGLAGMLSLRAQGARPPNLVGVHAPSTDQLAVIAFQDPDDFLGFKASDTLLGSTPEGVKIIDVVHRNAPQWAYLFAWPTIAHDHELREPNSLNIILCGARAGADGRLAALPCPD